MSAGFEFSQTEWNQYAVNGVITESNQIRSEPGLSGFPPSIHSLLIIIRILYRAGAACNSFPVKDIKGETIREIWGTVELGLPLLQNQAHLDLTINYGIRGDLTDNGIQKNIWRFSISLTGSEKWFVRKY